MTWWCVNTRRRGLWNHKGLHNDDDNILLTRARGGSRRKQQENQLRRRIMVSIIISFFSSLRGESDLNMWQWWGVRNSITILVVVVAAAIGESKSVMFWIGNELQLTTWRSYGAFHYPNHVSLRRTLSWHWGERESDEWEVDPCIACLCTTTATTCFPLVACLYVYMCVKSLPEASSYFCLIIFSLSVSIPFIHSSIHSFIQLYWSVRPCSTTTAHII